jgi:hypothetical protein
VDFDYENLEKQRAHGSCLSELQVRRKRVKAVKDRDTASLGWDYQLGLRVYRYIGRSKSGSAEEGLVYKISNHTYRNTE